MTSEPPRILLVSSVPSTPWAFYRRLPDYLRQRGMTMGVAAASGRELGYFRDRCAVATHAVSLTRRISPTPDLYAVLKLARVIRQNRYNLVHAHTPKGGLVGMLAAALASVPNRIYTMHGLPAETAGGLQRTALIGADRVCGRLAKIVLAVSRSLAQKVEALDLCRRPKLRVLGYGSACGVDVRRFSRSPRTLDRARKLRNRLNIPADAQVVGFVGRLVPDKGISKIVEAYRRIAERRHGLYLLFLGDFEPDRGRLADSVVRVIKTHPRIRQIPFDWDPIPYYALMDLLVLASHREGFPYSLLEAAAMELPTVATKVTGCVDAVIDGRTGLLVDPENPAELTLAVESLLDDAGLRRRMGQAGRDRVVKHFADEQLLRAHADLYASMVH